MLSVSLGLAGIALGTLDFVVLAHLAAYPTVQAIVFFLMVYSACARLALDLKIEEIYEMPQALLLS
jgi:hypothetical protein